jgi:hypothetical protein
MKTYFSIPLLVVLSTILAVAVTAEMFDDYSSTETTCTIMGVTYQDREAITNLQNSRCGSAVDFPCYCNPQSTPPVVCPYCNFVLEDDQLICLYDGETESFTNSDGVEETCRCSIVDDVPQPECSTGLAFSSGVDNEDENQITTQQGELYSDTCVIDLPDGRTETFRRGESLELFLPNNRCGDDFPCYCNPDVTGGIECPYCRFPTENDDLLCVRNGEQVSFVDLNGVTQSCSCEIPYNSPNTEPITNCNVEQDGFVQEEDANDVTTGRPVIDNSNDVCTLELESGQVVTFAFGESYGDYIDTRCGSSTEFPCFCNPAMRNQMECPYCGFVQADGELLCAKHNQVVSFNDGVEDQTCTCEIPTNPLDEPIQNCGNDNNNNNNNDFNNVVGSDGECTLVDLNGETVTIPDGESFGDLVEGVCGDSIEWPAFCNTQLESTIKSRAGTEDLNSVEYPYCVYSDTITGETICGHDGQEITYLNTQGEEIACSCLYDSPGMGGAQSTCRPAGQSEPPKDVQTAQPTAPPTFTPFSSGAGTTTASAIAVGFMLTATAALV